MKKAFLLLLTATAGLLHSQVKEGLIIPENPKIGLVLSGGGAKGFAHVGALKVLDSLKVKIDYVGGTSMGAVIGGLYATGHTGKEIEEIIRETNFFDVLMKSGPRRESPFFNKNVDKYLLQLPIVDGRIKLPSGLSSGQNNLILMKDFFQDFQGDQDFSKLPIPFFCIGTNIETGKMEQFEKGDLAKAIMASSAFPGLLEPVAIGDSLYVDGGITINYPAQQLKEKGMDIVIGVNLDQGLDKRGDLTDILSILNQIVSFQISRETHRQLEYTDINIQPILEGIGVTSFSEKERTIKLGYDETARYSYYLKELSKGVPSLNTANTPLLRPVFKIDKVEIKNDHLFNKDYILGQMDLTVPSLQTMSSIGKKIQNLSSTRNYTFVNYDIINEEGKNTLELDVKEDNTRLYLKFGLHYDETFKTGLLGNITARRFIFKNSTASLDMVFGDHPRYFLNYVVDNGRTPGLNLFSSRVSFDLVDQQGQKTESWTWYQNNIYVQSIWKRRFALGGGFNYDIFNRTVQGNKTTNHYLNPYLYIQNDSQDDAEFPTRGLYVQMMAKMLDLFGNKDVNHKRDLQLTARIKTHFPINAKLVTSLESVLGTSFGTTPHFYKFRPGGLFEQDLGNFVSLPGYRFGDLSDNNILKLGLQSQYNVWKDFYLIGNFQMASLFDDISDTQFLSFKYSSVGMTAGYKSPFGQIKLNYTQALQRGRKGLFYVILGHWF